MTTRSPARAGVPDRRLRDHSGAPTLLASYVSGRPLSNALLLRDAGLGSMRHRGAVLGVTVPRVAPTEDPVFEDLLRLIDQFGWAVRNVGAGAAKGEAVFSYTVGLTAMGHPEVVVTGLPFTVAQTFLNDIGHQVRDGQVFPAGLVTDGLTSPGAPVVFIQVDDDRGLTAVARVYGRVEAVQMVWPDSAGRLPWVVGYRNPPDAHLCSGPFRTFDRSWSVTMQQGRR